MAYESHCRTLNWELDYMLTRDYRDIIGGALLVFGGVAFSWYAAHHYDLGTLRRMGPGMFPMALGLVLAAFGVMLMIPAFFRTGSMPAIRVWSPLFVLSSVVAFGLLIRPFGLVPATLAVTIISSMAELRIRPISLALLCLSLCVIAWLTFKIGLGMPVHMVRWPF